MKYGKKVCQSLKIVRKQIADANEIPYEITECHHEGNCPGTCPKCESEVRYIENQLNIRRAAGKAVSLIGLSLGISATFASCANKPETIEETTPIVPEEEFIEGDMRPAPNDNATPSDSICPDYDAEGIMMPGEEIDPTPPFVVDLSAEEGPVEGEDPESEQIFTVVDQQPEFPGGEAALVAFVKQKLKYPEAIQGDSGIQGQVTISFTIEKDGSITDINVMRSPHEELSEEAIRVIKLMPKWRPGKKLDKAVRTKCILPITFRLG